MKSFSVFLIACFAFTALTQFADVDPSVTIPITQEEVDKFAVCTKSLSTVVEPLYDAYKDSFNNSYVTGEHLVNLSTNLKSFANDCLNISLPLMREKCGSDVEQIELNVLGFKDAHEKGDHIQAAAYLLKINNGVVLAVPHCLFPSDPTKRWSFLQVRNN